MSEIKGQLLGIVLVVTIFGAVAGVLLTAFKTATAEQITTEPSISEVSEAKNVVSASELLTF